MKTKVAILGGGLGGLSTAFWLTSTEALRARYDVTVYQQGFRLGGKGATGRDPVRGERVHEHGLHMFLGFYENAFRTLRACFAEWQRPAFHPWQSVDDAMLPQRRITLVEQLPGQAPILWPLDMPRLPGAPGTDAGGGGVLAVVDNALVWLDHLLPPGAHPALLPLRASIVQIVERLRVPGPVSGALALLLRAALRVAVAIDRRLSSTIARTPELRRPLWLSIVALSALCGWIEDVVPYERPGKDAYGRIDHKELRAWLIEHGCPTHVSKWAPIKALYDLGFAYQGGDASTIDNGKIAAGVGLKILLRIALAYKDAPLWRMAAGMGDTIMTPLYEVLVQRGVRVAFFHRTKRLHLSADQRNIDAIDVDVQADTRVAGRSYRPLVQVHRLGCWPSEPLYDQLAAGTPRGDYESAAFTHAVRTDVLQRGVDFDVAVLAIPKGALAPIAGELALHKPRWQRMLAEVPTVATQAAQLWLDERLASVAAPALQGAVSTGFVEPFDSFCDMTEVLRYEAWSSTVASTSTAPRSLAPRSLAYLCSPMPEPVVDADGVRARAASFLAPGGAGRTLLPGLSFDKLHDDAGGSGAARLDAQYFRANTDPSERYVQSFPGTIGARLWPRQGAGGTDVDNLLIAGDWTRSGLNAGSAEAAVESGMLASRALCGTPAVVVDTEEP